MSNASRDAEMLELYRAGKTLQEIGDLHGLTRERVRQILGGRHGSTLAGRRAAATERKDAALFRAQFAKAMRMHLWAAGFRRCCFCKRWVDLTQRAESSNYECRQCATDRHWQRYGKRSDLRGISQSERIKILADEGKILTPRHHRKKLAGLRKWYRGLSQAEKNHRLRKMRAGKKAKAEGRS